MEALVVRTRYPGELLIGLARGAVERDLHCERWQICEEIGNPLGDECAGCEECDEKALPFRVGIDVQEVTTSKDFPAGEEQPETALFRQLVQQAFVLLERELADAGGDVVHGQVVVAM